MPAALLTRDEVLERLFAVFRDHGYDGASLADLSKATGLGRSSLYHYFPGGKDDMARAVLDQSAVWIDRTLGAIALTDRPLAERKEAIAAALDEVYAQGRSFCVLAQLTAGSTRDLMHDRLGMAFDQWMKAFARLAEDSGMADEAAAEWSEDLVARLQGSLILAGATGATAAFERCLAAIRAL